MVSFFPFKYAQEYINGMRWQLDKSILEMGFEMNMDVHYF